MNPRGDTGVVSVPSAASIAAQRAEVERVVAESAPWVPEARQIDIVLLASELLTNAFRHASPGSVTCRVVADGDAVRIEVSDEGSTALPAPHQPAVTDTEGRGLWLVDQLADEHGVIPHAIGKTAWFAVYRDGRSRPDRN